ncbi:MAG TPA: DUF1800 family protein [Acidimicrobiales bacterium]|nr:DUF1800 family protein [Acidimicrobiales bacterium]
MARTEEERVAHVWRRLGFGPAPGDVAAGVNAGGATAVIDDLLSRATTTPTDWGWPGLQNDGQDILRLVNRLFELYATAPGAVQERVSWILTGLVVAAYGGQVQLGELRAHWNKLRAWPTTGTYRSLLSSVASSSAMQVYLTGTGSVPPHANENLARELMELFSLGVTNPRTGAANYSETDVKEIARALTGYKFDTKHRTLSWSSSSWDSGTKTFLGASRGAAKLADVINAVATHDSFRYFVPQRLYRELLGFDPSPSALDDMAAVWMPDGNLGALVAHIAHRPEFVADETIGNRVKPPVDLLVSAVRVLGKADLWMAHVWMMSRQLHQRPELPPNVSGWEGANWLSPGHIVVWSDVANALCTSDRGPSFDGTKYAVPPTQQNTNLRTFFATADRSTAADMAIDMAGLYDVSSQTRQAIDTFAREESTPGEEWTWERACGVMQMVFMSPEFLVG